MIEVCEYQIKCCPYCGSFKIKDTEKKSRDNCHIITCERCMGIFLTPCED